MNHRHRAELHPGSQDRVLVVSAGPVGCAAALLLAGFGIPVTLLERHAEPRSLPRAVHLDDEVARTLGRIGIGAGFLARSRPGSGLRLLDARHRVIAGLKSITALQPGIGGRLSCPLAGGGPENQWRCAR